LCLGAHVLMLGLLPLIFLTNVPELISEHQVSVIELNHVCSVTDHADGSRVVTVHLSQLIFWQLAADGVFYVRDWRYLKEAGMPVYDHQRKLWRVEWMCRTWDLYRITSPSYLETYSLIDREVENRKEKPIAQRRIFKR